jgi:hypothetical protein
MPWAALGKAEVVMTTGVAVMAMLRALVAAPLAESLTCTVKLEVPPVVGVPLMIPALLRVSPAGSVPAVIDH